MNRAPTVCMAGSLELRGPWKRWRKNRLVFLEGGINTGWNGMAEQKPDASICHFTSNFSLLICKMGMLSAHVGLLMPKAGPREEEGGKVGVMALTDSGGRITRFG